MGVRVVQNLGASGRMARPDTDHAVWTAGRGRKTPPMGGAMPLMARREGNRDDGIVQRREASATAAHLWACRRAKGRGDGKRLGHRWPGASGMEARWWHDTGRRVSRPHG
jgi:hypothetical protein